MNCRRIRKKFIAYIEGSLPERERRALEAHLESCPECARELEGLSATARTLRAARPEAPEPPPGFVSRVTAGLEDRRRAVPSAQRWAPATASVVAVAALAAILVVGNWHRFAAPVRVADEPTPRPSVTAVLPDDTAEESAPAIEDFTGRDEAAETLPSGPLPALAGAAEPPARTVPAGGQPPGVEGSSEPTHMADASSVSLYGAAGGGAGPAGPARPAAEVTEDEARELAARPVSIGPYNSDDEGSRLEEAMALFGY